jgi:hypothetical protein
VAKTQGTPFYQATNPIQASFVRQYWGGEIDVKPGGILE